MAAGLGVVGALAGAQPAAAVARTALNVRSDLTQFGGTNAVGDGVADDSDAIQAALNLGMLFGGVTIQLPQGRYKVTREMLVNTGVHLVGEGARNTTAAGKGISEVFASGYEGAVFRNVDQVNGNSNIRFSRLLIRGPSSSADFAGAISIVTTGQPCHGIEIDDCVVLQGGSAAIDFRGVRLSYVRNCFVGGDGAVRGGVRMVNSPDNHVVNNQITTGQGVSGGVGGPGLAIDGGGHVVIEGNVIYHSDDNIWLNADRCVISGNRLDSAWLDNVRIVGDSAGNVISGNVLYNHGRGGQSDAVGAHGVGLVDASHHTTVTGNSFGRWFGGSATPRYGVAIRGTSSDNAVVGNTFVDQTVGGVQLDGGPGNVVTGNAGQP